MNRLSRELRRIRTSDATERGRPLPSREAWVNELLYAFFAGLVVIVRCIGPEDPE